MPTYRVVVSPSALRDLRGILRATMRQWNEAESRDYELKITRALERLAEFPELGVSLIEFGAGTRAVICGQHRIYYRIDGDTVFVLRVLHQKMDA